MIVKPSAVAAFLAMAMTMPQVSCWSLNTQMASSKTALFVSPDSPMWSDDMSTTAMNNRRGMGVNPLNVQFQDTMVRKIYDQWREKYGRGDFDEKRFAIFKQNYFVSQRALQAQLTRTKLQEEGPTASQSFTARKPPSIELNAYADCTRDEYDQLKALEQKKLMEPRKEVPEENEEKDTKEVAKAKDETPVASAPVAETKPAEKKKAETPKKAAAGAAKPPAMSKEPPKNQETRPPPSASVPTEDEETPKKKPPQFLGVGMASEVNSNSLRPDIRGPPASQQAQAAAAAAAAKAKTPPIKPVYRHQGIGPAQVIGPASNASSSSAPPLQEPPTNTILPDNQTVPKEKLQEPRPKAERAPPKAPTVASATAPDKKEVEPPKPPATRTKPAGIMSNEERLLDKKPKQFIGVGTASQAKVAPRPAVKYIRPDNRGWETDKTATMFPARTPAHSAPPPPTTPSAVGGDPSQKNESISPDASKEKNVKPLQDQLEDLKKATDQLGAKKGAAATVSFKPLTPDGVNTKPPPQFKGVGTASQLPKPVSTPVRADLRGIFPDPTTSFAKRAPAQNVSSPPPPPSSTPPPAVSQQPVADATKAVEPPPPPPRVLRPDQAGGRSALFSFASRQRQENTSLPPPSLPNMNTEVKPETPSALPAAAKGAVAKPPQPPSTSFKPPPMGDGLPPRPDSLPETIKPKAAATTPTKRPVAKTKPPVQPKAPVVESSKPTPKASENVAPTKSSKPTIADSDANARMKNWQKSQAQPVAPTTKEVSAKKTEPTKVDDSTNAKVSSTAKAGQAATKATPSATMKSVAEAKSEPPRAKDTLSAPVTSKEQSAKAGKEIKTPTVDVATAAVEGKAADKPTSKTEPAKEASKKVEKVERPSASVPKVTPSENVDPEKAMTERSQKLWKAGMDIEDAARLVQEERAKALEAARLKAEETQAAQEEAKEAARAKELFQRTLLEKRYQVEKAAQTFQKAAAFVRKLEQEAAQRKELASSEVESVDPVSVTETETPNDMPAEAAVSSPPSPAADPFDGPEADPDLDILYELGSLTPPAIPEAEHDHDLELFYQLGSLTPMTKTRAAVPIKERISETTKPKTVVAAEKSGGASQGGSADDAAARQKEIEDALKADFNAAAWESNPIFVDEKRRQQVEAVFEGKVQVQTRQHAPSVPYYDPFAVDSQPPSKSVPSVEEVLKAEMEAAKSMQAMTSETGGNSIQAPIAASAPLGVGSIEDILKAEMEAAKELKAKSAEADALLSTPPPFSRSGNDAKVEQPDVEPDQSLKAGIDAKLKPESEVEAERTKSSPKINPPEISKKQRKEQKWNANRKKKNSGERNEKD